MERIPDITLGKALRFFKGEQATTPERGEQEPTNKELKRIIVDGRVMVAHDAYFVDSLAAATKIRAKSFVQGRLDRRSRRSR